MASALALPLMAAIDAAISDAVENKCGADRAAMKDEIRALKDEIRVLKDKHQADFAIMKEDIRATVDEIAVLKELKETNQVAHLQEGLSSLRATLQASNLAPRANEQNNAVVESIENDPMEIDDIVQAVRLDAGEVSRKRPTRERSEEPDLADQQLLKTAVPSDSLPPPPKKSKTGAVVVVSSTLHRPVAAPDAENTLAGAREEWPPSSETLQEMFAPPKERNDGTNTLRVSKPRLPTLTQSGKTTTSLLPQKLLVTPSRWPPSPATLPHGSDPPKTSRARRIQWDNGDDSNNHLNRLTPELMCTGRAAVAHITQPERTDAASQPKEWLSPVPLEHKRIHKVEWERMGKPGTLKDFARAKSEMIKAEIMAAPKAQRQTRARKSNHLVREIRFSDEDIIHSDKNMSNHRDTTTVPHLSYPAQNAVELEGPLTKNCPLFVSPASEKRKVIEKRNAAANVSASNSESSPVSTPDVHLSPSASLSGDDIAAVYRLPKPIPESVPKPAGAPRRRSERERHPPPSKPDTLTWSDLRTTGALTARLKISKKATAKNPALAKNATTTTQLAHVTKKLVTEGPPGSLEPSTMLPAQSQQPQKIATQGSHHLEKYVCTPTAASNSTSRPTAAPTKNPIANPTTTVETPSRAEVTSASAVAKAVAKAVNTTKAVAAKSTTSTSSALPKTQKPSAPPKKKATAKRAPRPKPATAPEPPKKAMAKKSAPSSTNAETVASNNTRIQPTNEGGLEAELDKCAAANLPSVDPAPEPTTTESTTPKGNPAKSSAAQAASPTSANGSPVVIVQQVPRRSITHFSSPAQTSSSDLLKQFGARKR